MQYQLTRHLEVSFDENTGPFQKENYLFINQLFGTRLLGDDSSWSVLKAYETPKALENSTLTQRAVAAGILIPVEEKVSQTPLGDSFKDVAERVLRYRKVEPSSTTETLIAQLNEACHPIGAFNSSHYMWHEPKRLFQVMLDHFQTYLEVEVGQAQTGPMNLDFAKLSLGRPQRNGEFAQQLCTLSTSLARAQLVWERYPSGAKILTLGDDDLMSLALTQKPGFEVTVFEIDPALVRFLHRRKNSSVHLYSRDLSNGLPEEFQGCYDVVLADPPYNVEGMNWFLDCCVKALRQDNSVLYLSTSPGLLENYEQLLSKLDAEGLEIERTLPHFNRYPFPRETHTITQNGLLELGFHPSLIEALMRLPYLYAHLYECVWKEA